VLKDGAELREGEVVTVLARDDDDLHGVHVSPDDEAELVAAMAEADRGEGMGADEFFAQLRRERAGNAGS